MKQVLPRTTVMKLEKLRGQLARAFRPDTAAPGTTSPVPSAGHCAAVAAVVNAELGGQFVSTIVDGQSHWFNRLEARRASFDVDLTGDQFGLAELRIAREGELFPSTRLRSTEQLNRETLERARLLAERAGLPTAEQKLALELTRRFELAFA